MKLFKLRPNQALRPCPFCHQPVRMLLWEPDPAVPNDIPRYNVECRNKRCWYIPECGTNFKDPERAIKIWNGTHKSVKP